MSTIKKLLIAAIVLIVIGLVGSLLTIKPLLQGSNLVSEELIIEEHFSDVEIEVKNMSINLHASTDNETKIITSVRESEKTYVEVTNNLLTVSVDEPAIEISIFNFGFLKDNPSLTIYVPQEHYNKITVKSDNGIITSSNLQTEELIVETTNSLINVSDSQSKSTTVSSVNGKIELEQLTGDITSWTTNGMISYVTDDIDQNLDFKTVNGLILIQTKNEPTNATFDLSVDLGQVDIFGSSRDHIVYGDGESRIRLTTSLGKVSVEQKP